MDEFKIQKCEDCGKSVMAKLLIDEKEFLNGYHGECPVCGWRFWDVPDIEMDIAKCKLIITKQIEQFYKLAPSCQHNGGTHVKLAEEMACMQDNAYRHGNDRVCNFMTCPITVPFLEVTRK
jgi:hypothetical protein